MSIKLIAIGNRLMGDDGAAIIAAGKIKATLIDRGIEVIIGETDVDFCLGVINDNDFVFILDSTQYGISPGSISLIPLKDHKSYGKPSYSQHEISLIKALNIYKPHVMGYIIGIEAAVIEFNLNLSSQIDSRLNSISTKIIEVIDNVLNKL
ncbi:MAG: hydrogenase maturation protease [Bacillota bacterium]|nr:hydrogenase maturation protease [Bacillota bacterium]